MTRNTFKFRVPFDPVVNTRVETAGDHVPLEAIQPWYPELSRGHLGRLIGAMDNDVLVDTGSAGILDPMDQMAGPNFCDRITAEDMEVNLRQNRAAVAKAATQLRATTDPSNRTTGRGHHLPSPRDHLAQHLTEVSTLHQALPYPRHLKDNVMARLLNDSYISLMRRGTQVDLANLGQTSRFMQEAFGRHRGRRPHLRVREVVKEYHQLHLTRLHAMPNWLMATKLWVSESIATGGMLQVVVSAWQAYTESWMDTTVGIQDK
jgi:hypothetical protein